MVKYAFDIYYNEYNDSCIRHNAIHFIVCMLKLKKNQTVDIVLCMPKLMKYHATTILLM